MVFFYGLLILVVTVGTWHGALPDDDVTCPAISEVSCPTMTLPGSDDVIQMVPKRLPGGDYRLPDHPEMDGIKLKLICAEPDCLSNPCLNGGTCQETYDGFKCLCTDGRTGNRCQEPYRDCTEIYNAGVRTSGVYEIYPSSDVSVDQEPITVYCNMDQTSGGWLVIQRRYDGSVNFYLKWPAYKAGFGNLETEFWLGNDAIHRITSQGAYRLRIDMVDINGNSWRALYTNFRVADGSDKYRLNLEYESASNVSDALSYHNGQPFSTIYYDNDKDAGECAVKSNGGWWYNACYTADLNGRWSSTGNTRMVWKLDDGTELKMRASTMEIKVLE